MMPLANLLHLPGVKQIRRLVQRHERATQQEIIRAQARKHHTVRIDYTNRAGERRTREVEPYEIKGGFLWAVDRAKPENIRMYNIRRIHDVSPGTHTYEPQWEVKLGEYPAAVKVAGLGSAIKAVIAAGKTPRGRRVEELAIGGLIGAGAGATTAKDSDDAQVKKLRALKGALIGAGTAAGLSKIVRQSRLERAVKKTIERNPEYRFLRDNTGAVKQQIHNQEVNNYIKQHGGTALQSLFDREGKVVSQEAQKAFFHGLAGAERPAGRLTQDLERVYTYGRNWRAAALRQNRKAFRRDRDRIFDATVSAAKETALGENMDTLERYNRLIHRKLFGAL